MTSLMTSSRIIIIDTNLATSQTSLPVSFTEVLVSFNRCALLRYLHRLILASEPCRLPACPSVILSFCLSVRKFGAKYLGTRLDSGMVTMDGLYKLAYGLSIGHSPDDVMWPDDVMMVTSSFFFKMFLLRQFLSEFDDTSTPCSPIWCVYMVLTDSQCGS